MSDYETLDLILSIIMIVVMLTLALINTKK